jgi:hypothetical protein
MSRPADLSKYVEGDPCKKCGGTLYRRKTVCVGCEAQATARRYAARSGKVYDPSVVAKRPVVTQAKLSSAMEGYRRSPSARERSARLDALILRKSIDQEAPLTAGDVWRASLRVGVPEKPPSLRSTAYAAQRPKRHAENAALRKAVKRILSSLPDVVHVGDVLAAVPEAVVVPINRSRRLWAIGTALRDLGIRPHKCAGRARLYVIRNHHQYDGLSSYAIERRIRAGNRLPAVSGRSSKSKIQGDAPGARKAAQRSFVGQREALSGPPVTGCDNGGIPTGDR